MQDLKQYAKDTYELEETLNTLMDQGSLDIIREIKATTAPTPRLQLDLDFFAQRFEFSRPYETEKLEGIFNKVDDGSTTHTLGFKRSGFLVNNILSYSRNNPKCDEQTPSEYKQLLDAQTMLNLILDPKEYMSVHNNLGLPPNADADDPQTLYYLESYNQVQEVAGSDTADIPIFDVTRLFLLVRDIQAVLENIKVIDVALSMGACGRHNQVNHSMLYPENREQLQTIQMVYEAFKVKIEYTYCTLFRAVSRKNFRKER